MNQDRDKLKLSAILSADVVGYSRLMEEDQAWTIKNLEENRTLISNLVEEYRGRVVDAPGDNLLAEFTSITNAVECAVKIQEELKKKNANIVENRRMEFRIGINLGEVFEEGGRIYGSGVNIAARIEGLSKSGGICISGRTYDHIKSKFDFGYEFLGEHTVKNISEPIRVYRLLMEPENVGKIIGEKKTSSRASHRISIASIIILIIIAAGLLTWRFYPNQPEKLVPKTIAVLPFEDISPENDQEYFVDGLSEEILNSLANIPNLTVIARTSSFAFKGSNKKIKEIAKELGVDHVLEGSVRKSENTIRITAQLIKADDESHLWSETYNKEFNVKEILAIQEDIASSVADKLKLTLEAFKLLGGTENIEAYELYLNAKGLRSTDAEMTRQALELIDAAIDLDTRFALAWAEKAHNHTLLSVFGSYNRFLAEINAGLEAAQKAIELEPNLGDGYVYLGYIKAVKSNWIEARYNFHKALELIGESLSGDQDYIIIFHIAVGKFKKAQEILDKMRRNDPINQVIGSWYCYTYGQLGDRQRGEEEYQGRDKLLLKGYSDWYDESITMCRLFSGEALSRDEIVSSNPIHITLKEYLDSPEKGLVELRRIYKSEDMSIVYNLNIIATWAAYFGDLEFSMEVLEKGSKINPTASWFWSPMARELRKTTRFKKYVREIGLVDYWKEFGWPDLCHSVGDDDFVCE